MVTAVIVAAGSSRRMGFDKLFAPLAGRPVIAHTLAQFQACPDVTEIVIVAKQEKFGEFQSIALDCGIEKLLCLTGGGEERQHSVYNGIKAGSANCPLVAIHDGARPLATPEMISKTIQAAREHGASVAACKVVDSIKEAREDGTIAKTVNRDKLWAVQTPQVFRKDIILAGYEEVFKLGLTVTDDTAAVELTGQKVMLVDTGRSNLKITTPEDLAIAEVILNKNSGNLVGE